MQPGDVRSEAARRRTFAIISHPDAGKTTLTEKFLLYAGAVAEAGAVKAREGRRRATSDWMAMEQERGISITSTVLQFAYRDHVVNLLDTPGHRDFSEDTYRVLAAADAAVMVLDVAKGIEAQTLKLFEVCRARNLPVITFLNKYDRPGRDPLELLDEIEDLIRLRPTPVTWPVGIPGDFRGVIDRRTATSSASPARCGATTEALEETLRPRRGAGRGEARAWPHALEECEPARRRRGRPRPGVVPGRRVEPAVRRLGADQLRRPPRARRHRRPRPRPVRPGRPPTARAATSTPPSPASCSRCRPTWTRPTATAWPSCGCAPAGSSGA